MIEFKPFTIEDNRLSLAPDKAWYEIITINGSKNIVKRMHDDGMLKGECTISKEIVLIDCDPFNDLITDTMTIPEVFDATVQHEKVILPRLFNLIDSCPYLQFVIRTENVDRVMELMPGRNIDCRGCGGRKWHYDHKLLIKKDCIACSGTGKMSFVNYDNLTLQSIITTQQEADYRIPELLKCKELVGKIGMHCVPTEMIDFDRQCPEMCTGECGHKSPYRLLGDESGNFVDIITASGDKYPVHPDWFRSIRDQCESAGCEFVLEGWGDFRPWKEDGSDSGGEGLWMNEFGEGFRKTDSLTQPGFLLLAFVGKDNSGRTLDGVIHDGGES